MPGRDLQAGGRLFQWEQQQILLYTERLRSRFLLTGTVIQNQRERKASLILHFVPYNINFGDHSY